MNGVYGTVRPADINPLTDVEIYYFYRPTRGTTDENFTNFKELDSSILVKSSVEKGGISNLLGMYNLQLPLDKFNKKGFYTIYIKPKEYKISLADVSVLVGYPDVKGIVIKKEGDIKSINDLSGYRVEYYDDNGARTEITRLITSSNECEPVRIGGLSNTSTQYQFANGSNYIFCTVTPSAISSYRPNIAPFIGSVGTQVSISNTKFNPVMIEIEMIEHDAETLTYMIEGDQIRDRDHGIITTYNKDKEIYHQADYFTIKNNKGEALYDVKQTRTNIDTSQDFDNIING